MIGMRSTTAGAAMLALCAAMAHASDAPVARAAREGDRTAIEALLARKADVNAPEVDGTTALHWAVRADNADLVASLLRAGANANAANRYGVTPIALAAATGDAAVMRALLDAGADATFTGAEGETALMIAARTGRVDAVRLLLAHGADVNHVERWYGQTALMWAAADNHADVVRALVDAGAMLDVRSSLLEPPKRDLADFRTDKKGAALQTLLTTFPKGGMTPMHFAARQGATDAINALAGAGANLNPGDPDGITPLLLAIRNGHYTAAAALIENGADVNAADAAGRTPLYTTIDMHSLDWIQNRPAPPSTDPVDSLDLATLLLHRGAAPNPALKSAPPGWKGDAVAAQNTFGVLAAGTTPFLRAARNADGAAMQLLLGNGADPNLATKNHVSALMALVGGLGRKYGADLHVSADEEKNAVQEITRLIDRGADHRRRVQRRLAGVIGGVDVGANGVVRFLVDRGARLEAKNKQGRTPRDEALRGMANVDGALNDPHVDTADLLADMMNTRGIQVAAKGAAAGAQ